MSLDISLNRVDRIYRPGDKVTGSLVVETSSGFAHSGATVQMTGVVTLQLSARSVGLFEAFYNSLKPITMADYTVDIEKSGKIADGRSEIPFEFTLLPLEGQELFETYHGVYVNVAYSLKADIIRKYLGKNLTKTVEFIVELPPKTKTGSNVGLGGGLPISLPVNPSSSAPGYGLEEFTISPENLEVSKKAKSIPDFLITGALFINKQASISTSPSSNSSTPGTVSGSSSSPSPSPSSSSSSGSSAKWPISEPFTGYLTLVRCEEPIKCIELQLVRVETCGCAEGFAKEADGDLVHGVQLPVHMVFPRLFTCPTVAARTFKIDFEINIVLMFPDGRLVTKK